MKTSNGASEYQFQIELLQAERDAAWTRLVRDAGERTRCKANWTRLGSRSAAAEFQGRVDQLQRERDDARSRFEKWRLNADDQVDLSGPPSTRTNLTPETFGLEHTDLKLGVCEDRKGSPDECAGLREQLAL